MSSMPDNAFPETDNAFPETDNAFPETEGLLFCTASFSYQGHFCVQHNHKLSAGAHGTDIIQTHRQMSYGVQNWQDLPANVVPCVCTGFFTICTDVKMLKSTMHTKNLCIPIT